ncbi:MAG: arginine--tRNA ligase [Lachnospiraceae bacterium]|uniref:Arginine--tRNA ligase n=1 Tax=Candidatus Weimeria bifida TaxID=2599074 RepID=A0A6N7IXA0_9FIRM|nr:arginine--tRNA ligase [Candidatus Weimeria bifida]RRF96019.1 MAG: arginine--tRNA ligase [Lachnospiraceae bacterium]
MKELIELIEEEVRSGFTKAGLDASYGRVTVSNRPDLCEYQCNGAMAAAKQYHKAPIIMAQAVAENLEKSSIFSKVEAVKPGFLNFNLSASFLADYANGMASSERFGLDKPEKPLTIILDYGGPNVAKPLHVGHLRSAVIGEAIKRIAKFMGHTVIGDVHLGDWGLQMGLIITELHERKPDLIYFDENYTGDYPEEPPFTISELEEIYPLASGKSKEDEAYHEKALEATKELQNGRRGYQALLKHIMDVSVTDLKKNYQKLNVSFDLWKGESDAAPYIPDMVEDMKKNGYAHESEGALVVDVKEDSDKKEIPPCMILKSDGAALYNTTDLATMIWRVNDYHPDRIAYVVDKRQELHFIQCFRAARKCGIVPDSCGLDFIGFGTMNGKDGKPFKTREGGVMRLSTLIADVDQKMLLKIKENNELPEEEAKETADIVGLAAIKYGDLSNQPSKDYIFDVDKFTSFEGNTGPYILYTIVRMKSIIRKYEGIGRKLEKRQILAPETESERSLLLALAPFQDAVRAAYNENMPNRICQYIYELANAFNHFYHETKILSCEDKEKQDGYMSLLELTSEVLECGIDLLGFSAPERM